MAGEEASAPALRLPLFAGSVAAALLIAGPGHAQDADQAPKAQLPEAQALKAQAPEAQTTAPQTLSGLLVRREPTHGYKVDEPAILKLTQPIIDTPQMVDITSRQLMDDRMATSLTDVFRNTSSISIAAGESSWQGTSLSLRGFNARNDMYLDGMRDFGSYTRDPWDLEAVEVLEGPSSILFGRGSTGGAINQVTKAPVLADVLDAELTGGTDDLVRGTVDVGGALPQLGEGAAFRFDAMGHSQSVTGRDEVGYSRWGVAPSLAFGLGTPTRLTLSYFHQSEDDLPDYGLPYLRGAPAPVPRNNFYGFSSDYLKTDVDIGTALFEHDFSPSLMIRDQLRYANYWRDWRDMEPQVITTGLTATTPLSAIEVNRALQGGHSLETFGQNQMDLVGSFRLAGLEHDFSAGWEAGPESSAPTYDEGLDIPPTSLLHPNERQPFSGLDVPAVTVDTTAFTVGVYAIDTVKLGAHWEVTGGVRWDRFDSHYVAQFYSVSPATLGQPTRRQDVRELDEKPSWRASLVYKPAPDGSIYFDYSTSFNPSAEALSQIVAVRSFNTGNIGLAPEDDESFELGAKWDLLANHLQLQSAVFREEKTNAREPDPADPQFNILAGDQRIDGAEIIADGRITDAWRVDASYTYLLGKTIKTVQGGPPLGSPLFNVPQDSIALWTTYQLTPRVAVGGGLNYLDRRYAQITSALYTSVPAYTVLDAMVKWQATRHVAVQVNVDNLTDADYYDQIHNFHVIPGEGLTALFSVAYTR